MVTEVPDPHATLRTPWATTSLVPTLQDVVSGRNSAGILPRSNEEALRILEQERKRIAEESYTTETQQSMKETLKGRMSFHHYYKKHMTILGLEHELHSSDSDSETDENYHTKLFKRRMHFPVTSRKEKDIQEGIHAEREAEKVRERLEKKKQGWTYRCPSVAEVGVHHQQEGVNNNNSTHRGGKRVYPCGFEPDSRYVEPTKMHRTPLQRYEHWKATTNGDPTTLPNPWDARVAAAEVNCHKPRRATVTPPSVNPTNVELLKKRIEAEHSELVRNYERNRRKHNNSQLCENNAGLSLATVVTTRPSPVPWAPKANNVAYGGPNNTIHQQRSVSVLTESKISNRVDELIRSERESLGRHKAIMSLVRATPICDPLNGCCY